MEEKGKEKAKLVSIQQEEDLDDGTATTVNVEDGEIVSAEEALAKCGGFGRFQKLTAFMNIVALGSAAFFLYAFVFLELQPKYQC